MDLPSEIVKAYSRFEGFTREDAEKYLPFYHMIRCTARGRVLFNFIVEGELFASMMIPAHEVPNVFIPATSKEILEKFLLPSVPENVLEQLLEEIKKVKFLKAVH